MADEMEVKAESVESPVEVPAKFKKLVEEIEAMSVLELSELVKVFEKKFGVSAAAVAVAGPAAGGLRTRSPARTMHDYMEPIARIMGSAVRLRLLRLFCFNDAVFTLDEMAFRSKSTKENVRRETALLLAAGFLEKRSAKNGKVVYAAARRTALFDELRRFLLATTSIDHARIGALMRKAGTVKLLVLTGVFTDAIEAAVDIVVVGDKLDERIIAAGVHLIEAELGRELRYANFETATFNYRLGVYDRLIRDVLDYPHETLINKLGIDRA